MISKLLETKTATAQDIVFSTTAISAGTIGAWMQLAGDIASLVLIGLNALLAIGGLILIYLRIRRFIRREREERLGKG